MTHNAENDAAMLDVIRALVDEATGYSVPYKQGRFMPIDSAFTNALKDALGVRPGHACVIPPGEGDRP
jgi:hypothetical protein